MMKHQDWIRANQELIAKALGELTFEQIIAPVMKDDFWELLLASGVTYTFSGKMSIWEHLRVNPSSIYRNGISATSSGEFFMDSANETKMDDIILGNFLEEMNNTLYSDVTLIQKRAACTVEDLTDLNGDKLQAFLNGHPKILLNKGRIGWGAEALSRYSPENETSFQLHWALVSNKLLKGEIPSKEIIDQSFSEMDRKDFLGRYSIPQDFTLLPVHPWQWDRFIAIQFAGEIARGEIISLGQAGDFYRPQISLRTLSNIDRPEKVDIKLPLSILNTSCIRGLPAGSISIGPKVSSVLNSICQQDPLLAESATEILSEVAGVAVVQKEFEQIKGAPYRYHEFLGAVWRESSRSKINNDEKAIIVSSLFYKDEKGKSLIGEYITKSGLSQVQWLKKYFQVIVIPLYHLQLEYGIGMVAHGQNIVLRLKNNAPAGMLLKDFQGDLRLLQELPPKGQNYLGSLHNELTKLPADYLIHDLITGHFVTVLRFISEVMEDCDQLSEVEFYQILSDELQAYASGRNISPEQSLLTEYFQRVLLNKVRFAIGYSDSANRPLPMTGKPLKNPLYPVGLRT